MDIDVCWCALSGVLGHMKRVGVPSLVCHRELPVELESRAEEEELEINVEDLTEEKYVPKKKTFHPFSGRGYRLGR